MFAMLTEPLLRIVTGCIPALLEEDTGYISRRAEAEKEGTRHQYYLVRAAQLQEKPQNASLLKGMTPETVDLATALKLLTLPRQLGVYPENNETITAFNGRFGPYVKCGEETRSLPAGVSPIEVTLAEAIELLKQP